MKTLKALIWKCLLQRKRNWIMSLVELLCLAITAFLVYKHVIKEIWLSHYSFDGHHYFYFVDSSNVYQFTAPISAAIAYTPHSNITDQIMNNFYNQTKRTSEEIETRPPVPMNSESNIEEWLTVRRSKHKGESIAIVFLINDDVNKMFEYKIRTNLPEMVTRGLMHEFFHQIYDHSDFLRVQFNVDKAILRSIGFNNFPNTISFGQLPAPTTDITEVFDRFYVYLAFGSEISLVLFLNEVLHETCSGVKEIMKIMGVSSKMFWFHWLIYSMLSHLPFSVVLSLILNALSSPFSFIHLFIVWVIVILYLLNSTLILLVASTLIKSRYVGFIAVLSVWLSLHIMAYPVFSKVYEVDTFLQTAFMILPLYNLTRAIYSIASFYGSWTVREIFNRGIKRRRISVAFSLLVSAVELVALIVIFILLNTQSLGINPVLEHCPYFYQWLRYSKKDDVCVLPSRRRSLFESPFEEMNILLDVKHLHKKYGGLTKKGAVEGLSLAIYEREVLSIVGQRGAGKTTVLCLLSAIIRPSYGQIIFEGKDLFKENVNYHKYLGFCPKRNWYFQYFTVIEHLVFCGMVKGLSKNEAFSRGNALLIQLKITIVRDVPVFKLPESLKKKVCIAVCIMGNPTILILDEPTSGMDHQTRREVWDIIMEERGLRTVVISTDNMDEGEGLGDRIAIIDHGRLVCCGSSDFLKKLFKTGYSVGILTKTTASIKKIRRLVKKHDKTATVEIVTPTYINIIIKEDCVTKLPNLLEALERRAWSLRISGIDLKCSTMEDVFLSLREDPSEEYRGEISELNYNTSVISKITDKAALAYQRFKTIFRKRLLHESRRIYIFLIVLVATSITMTIGSHSIGEATSHFETGLKIEDIYNPLFIDLHLYTHSISIITYDTTSQNLAIVATGLIKQHNRKVISDFGGKLEFMSYLDSLEVFNALLWIRLNNNSNITMRYRGVNHVACAATNLLSNILLRNYTNAGKIHLINHPLGFKKECSMNSSQLKKAIVTYTFDFFFTVTLIIVMMTSIPFTVEERVSGFKLQQFLTGVSPALYVAGNFVFDFLLYTWAAVIYLIIVVLFSRGIFKPDWTFHGHILHLIAIVVMFGVSGILRAYLISFLIDNLVFGMFMFFTIEMAQTTLTVLLAQNAHVAYKYYVIFVSVLGINPLFATVMAITELLEVTIDQYMCKVCRDKTACGAISISPSEKIDPLTFTNESDIFLFITILTIDSILYLFILLLIEYGVTRKLYVRYFYERASSEDAEETPKDPEVHAEMLKVRYLIRSGDKDVPLKVDGLMKVMKMRSIDQRSVNNVSFAVSQGECFGLLGVMGAGKTTVLKMLAGDILPTFGVSVIYNYNVLTQRRKYQKCIGYCPQKDALLDVFTGAETLSMICLLKGISQHDTKHEVRRWLQITDMEDSGNERIADYSSDQKRMLSIAMALIGNPVVVLLDEPTTGLDPKSRRRIWSVLESCRNAGQAIVLSSTSIHECETLCTRLTILKDGVMRCIGTPEYLRENFSQGFTVFIKLNIASKEKRERLKEDLFLRFPNGYIIDDHSNVIHYQIFDVENGLSFLISELLWIRDKYDFIEDLTVNNTTFELLFLTIIKTNITQSRTYWPRFSIEKNKLSSFIKLSVSM